MLSKTSRFWSVVALVLSSSLITPSWGRANEKVTEFNIPPQPLDSALLIFAEQAEVQVSVSTIAIKGMTTQGVVGRFTPSAALGRLLSATGLKFSTVGERTYSVSLAADSKGADDAVREAYDGLSETDGVMHLAQAPAEVIAPNPTTAVPKPQDSATDSRGRSIIEEVLVTGTHIRGQRPVGANVIMLDRQEIDRTGYATVTQVVQALPQNFGGGANEANSPARAGVTDNTSAGSSINLRGLGSGATLVLVNGRRLAPAGLNASFTDVASIPLAAIERIDVLPDGASAVYGADAVGGVVNMILRRDYEGADTRVQFGYPTEGGAESRVLGQTLGSNWQSGNALISYEYYGRDALFSRERDATANADLRPLGGSDFRSRQGSPGTIAIGSRTWAIPPGQDGRNLDPASLVEGTSNPFNGNQFNHTLPEQERHSGYLAVSQALWGGATVFADALYTRRDALSIGSGEAQNLLVTNANPFYVNPTGATTPVTVRYNFINDLGPMTTDFGVQTVNTALGIEIPVGADWTIVTYGAWAREIVDQHQRNRPIAAALNAALRDTNPATAFNAFGDGSGNNPTTLAAISGRTTFLSMSKIKSAVTTATGPILSMPGGDLGLALGAEFRRQDFDIESRTPTGSTTVTERKRDRDISAAFAEVRIPIVGEGNARRGIARLELSAAGRYERFDDFGSEVSPKVGLAWAPADGFSIHGTWSTSFKPPNLPNLNEALNATAIFPFPDSESATGFSDVLLWSGQNADLKEESGESWTLGFHMSPTPIPEFQLDVTYFRTVFDDRIQEPLPPISVTDPATAAFWNRNPTPEQRAAACSRSTFFGVNPADCLNAPIGAFGDFRVQNMASTEVRGFDLTTSYSLEAPIGRFDMSLSGTYLSDFSAQQVANLPWIDLLNTPRNPVDLRLRGSATWSRGGLSAGATVNYTGDYKDNISIPNRRIGSWSTVDLQLGYRVGAGSGAWLDDTSFTLNVFNSTNRDPPFFNNPGGVAYDPTNSDVTGRLVSLQVLKGW